MKHIYKPDGEHKTETGLKYSIKCVNTGDVSSHLKDGWFKSIEDLINSLPDDEKKKELAKIKKLEDKKDKEE